MLMTDKIAREIATSTKATPSEVAFEAGRVGDQNGFEDAELQKSYWIGRIKQLQVTNRLGLPQ